MANLSTFIDVSTSVAGGGIPRRAFGRGLLVSTDSNLSAGGSTKAKLFTSLSDAEDFFSSTSETLAAARAWFSASPPAQGLYVGRWADTAVSTSLRGSTPAAVSEFSEVNSTFTVNGNTVTADLSSASTYSAVATALQTAIRRVTGFSSANFVYDTDAFLITLSDDSAITGGILGDTVSSTDTDIADLLGMGAASTPTYVEGHAQESLAAALDEMISATSGGRPTAVCLDGAVPLVDPVATGDTRIALANKVQADGDLVCAIRDFDRAVLSDPDTTSLAATRLAQQQDRVAVCYAASNTDYIDVAMLALFSGQDLNTPASLITGMAKSLPGVQPVDITDKQLATLRRKRVNVYINVGGVNVLVEGFTSKNGGWLDAQWWLLWLRAEIEAAAFNTMLGARRYTRPLLRYNLSNVMVAGVSNGGIQGGKTVSAVTQADIITTTGNNGFDGVLSSGYLVWIPQFTQADRDSRNARFKIWLTGSDAIHQVHGDIVFSN